MAYSWFRVDSSVVDHPKVMALNEALGTPLAGWYVVRLWSWTQRYAPNGRIRGAFSAQLESAMCWQGARGALIEAMKSCALIDDENGDIVVHDWWDQQGALVERSNKEAELKRKKRRTPGARPAHAKLKPGERTLRDETRRDETLRDEINKPSVAESATVACGVQHPGNLTDLPRTNEPSAPVQPKRAKKAGATDPRHAPLVEALAGAFLAAKGTGYGFCGRDAKAVSSLLAWGEPADVLARWCRALAFTGYRKKLSAIYELADAAEWNFYATDQPGVVSTKAPVRAETQRHLEPHEVPEGMQNVF